MFTHPNNRPKEMYLLIGLLVFSVRFYSSHSLSTNTFIAITLKKSVDEYGARVLQEIFNSGFVKNKMTYKFQYAVNATFTLDEKYQDDKYLQHYGWIEIGTPVQRFEVSFNPASSLATIPGFHLKKKCQGKFRAFDQLSSHSFHSLGETIMIGKDEVHISRDHFHLGKVNITNQHFGLVEDGNCEKDTVYDGEIGLGFSANYLTLLDNMVKQKIINQSIVGLYLDRNVRRTFGGEVALGNWNPKFVAKDQTFNYIHIVSSELPVWQILITHAFIGNSQVTFDRFAIIDSSSYFIDLPWYEANVIAQNIGAFNYKGNMVVNCTNITNLLDLEIKIEDQIYTLHPTDYIDLVNSYKGYCTVLIRSTRNTVWNLGGAFLGKYYSIFNYENRTVVFAELVPQKSNGILGYSNFIFIKLISLILLFIAYN